MYTMDDTLGTPVLVKCCYNDWPSITTLTVQSKIDDFVMLIP